MIASSSPVDLPDNQRIVITGIGLTAPNGNDLATFRESLLDGPQWGAAVRGALFRQDAGGHLRF